MNKASYPDLLVSLPQSKVDRFASLLQHGIFIPIEREIQLSSFLLDKLGFSREYIETAIQTIFIDGVAADRFDIHLHDGTVLALSAAMPGLAGAIFRRQGMHGVLRSQPAERPISKRERTGFVTVKMFNLIAKDQITKLLGQGILIKGAAFNAFSKGREYLFEPPTTISFNGDNVEYSQLSERVAGLQIIRLQTRPITVFQE